MILEDLKNVDSLTLAKIDMLVSNLNSLQNLDKSDFYPSLHEMPGIENLSRENREEVFQSGIDQDLIKISEAIG